MTLRKLKQDEDIIWPNWDELVNEVFIPAMTDKSRFIILWGGRGSGKSWAAAMKIVYLMLRGEHCKVILIRKTLESISGSSYAMIEAAIRYLGLEHLFQFMTKPKCIRCVNGNEIVCRQLENIGRIKSMSEYSIVWFEEEHPLSFKDLTTITTTIRTTKSYYNQFIFTLNPVTPEADYRDSYFWQRFFEENEGEKSFKTKTLIPITKTKLYEETVLVVHSTFRDNPHIDDGLRANLISLQTRDPHLYITENLGLWATEQRTGLYYHGFEMANNVVPPILYDESRPLHCSLDQNVSPYMAMTIFQFVGTGTTHLACIDEIKTVKEHSVEGACKEFVNRYRNHTSGLYVYGDVSLRQRSTLTEAGYNGLKAIENTLAFYRPEIRIPSVNPNVKDRGDFLNNVFKGNITGVTITINENCKTLISDLMTVEQNKDGKKIKKKKKGVGEVAAHMCDSFDYAAIEIFDKEFYTYVNGFVDFEPIIGFEQFRSDLGY